MGTLFDELQKWMKSPVKPKKQERAQTLVKEWRKEDLIRHPSKGAGAGHPVAKAGPNAKSTLLEVANNVPRDEWCAATCELHPKGCPPPKGEWYFPNGAGLQYLVGQYALDTATMAGIHVQSLAYRTGHSPFLAPFALRFSPEQAYVDLGRLCPWDQWKVLWTRIGAHYFQDYGG